MHFSIGRGLVVRLAAVLSWGIICSDSAPIGVGVKEEERLEVTFDTFADHIFPPGADLQQKDKGKPVNAHARARADLSTLDTGILHLYVW